MKQTTPMTSLYSFQTLFKPMRCLLPIMALLMLGCAATPPQDKATASVTAAEQETALLEAALNEATACYVDLPAMDQASFEEYDSFRAWRKARQPGSSDYQGFLVWLEYQEYLRLNP